MAASVIFTIGIREMQHEMFKNQERLSKPIIDEYEKRSLTNG
jgi:hypothetical protein